MKYFAHNYLTCLISFRFDWLKILEYPLNLNYSAQQLQAELARLQAGRSSNFQVVSFQSQLQNAESAELGAVIGYVNALTTLDQVLGTTLDTWRITLNPP